MAIESPVPCPSDWPVVRLADLAPKIGSGATPRGGSDSYLLKRERFALIRSQNVFDRHFDEDGLAFISNDQAERLKAATVKPGDLLLNITGDGITFSRVCAAPEHILPACVNQHVAIIRVDPRKADAKYVLSFLVHPRVKLYIESFNAGGSRRAITKGNIENFLLPLPSLAEQRAIGVILSSYDNKIELNRRMAQTLEAMARALFKSWFVDFDPVRAKAEGQPTGLPHDLSGHFPDRLGDDGMPEGWASTAGKIGELVRSMVDPRNVEAETLYIGLEHLERRSLLIQQWGSARDVGSGKTEFQRGDLLFGKLRPYFHKVAVAPNYGICSSDIFVFRPVTGVPPSFLYMTFSEHGFVESASSASSGTRMPRAEWSYMRQRTAVLPPKELLDAFDQIVSPLFDRLLVVANESRTLADLRDTLLPKLISGELRITDAEKRIAVA